MSHDGTVIYDEYMKDVEECAYSEDEKMSDMIEDANSEKHVW